MNNQQFRDAIRTIETNYGKPLKDSQIEMMWHDLNRLNAKEFSAIIEKVMGENKTMPPPKIIKSYCDPELQKIAIEQNDKRLANTGGPEIACRWCGNIGLATGLNLRDNALYTFRCTACNWHGWLGLSEIYVPLESRHEADYKLLTLQELGRA